MKLDQALKIIKQVAAAFVGNLQDHKHIQEAVRTLEEAIKPKPKPVK